MAMAVTTCPNGSGNSLHNSSVVMANRILAIVDGKVAADEVGSHGGILLGQVLCGIVCIRLVFAVVHCDDTSISSG
jgi:hypothetical protein